MRRATLTQCTVFIYILTQAVRSFDQLWNDCSFDVTLTTIAFTKINTNLFIFGIGIHLPILTLLPTYIMQLIGRYIRIADVYSKIF